MLAKFLLESYVSVSRSKKAVEQAILVCCPVDLEMGIYLMIGIPPVCEDSSKNFFGKAFEQAAMNTNASVSLDFFESSIAQIKQSDLTKFWDGLTVLLTSKVENLSDTDFDEILGIDTKWKNKKLIWRKSALSQGEGQGR